MPLNRSNAPWVANPLSEVQQLDNDFGKGECQKEGLNEHEEPLYESVILARHPHTQHMEGEEGEAIEGLQRKAHKRVDWVKIAKCIKLILWIALVFLLFKHSLFHFEKETQSGEPSSCLATPIAIKKTVQERQQHLLASLLMKFLVPQRGNLCFLKDSSFASAPPSEFKEESEPTKISPQWQGTEESGLRDTQEGTYPHLPRTSPPNYKPYTQTLRTLAPMGE